MASGGWGEGCQPNTDKTPLTDIVVHTLVQDHLSPAVARMLAVDAPHFWWGPQRGQALLESWQYALLDALETSLGPTYRVGFEQPLASLSGGLDPAPAVYFNATDADSGHVVWFGNRDRGTVGSHRGGKGPRHGVNVSIGQAVLHSSRFPIVSPAGRFDAGEKGVGFRRLVDGGYFDNSGTATLLALLPPEVAAAPANLRLINLNGNPPDAEPSESKPPILTALRALLQVRGAHAEFAVEQFRTRVGAAQVLDLTFDLKHANFDDTKGERAEQIRRARSAPLGWYMSYGAAQSMAPSVAVNATQLCSTLGDHCIAKPPVQAPGAAPAPVAASAAAAASR